MTERDSRSELEALFPQLQDTGFVVTSAYDVRYNCVAFVAGDRAHWWEPEDRGGWFWPPGLPRDDDSLDNYFRCFRTLGFQACPDGQLEPGVEKIAIYVDADGDFSHVARQLSDGFWSSKLGSYEDVSHSSPEDLLNGRPIPYGRNIVYMSRPRREAGPGRSGLIVSRD